MSAPPTGARFHRYTDHASRCDASILRDSVITKASGIGEFYTADDTRVEWPPQVLSGLVAEGARRERQGADPLTRDQTGGVHGLMGLTLTQAVQDGEQRIADYSCSRLSLHLKRPRHHGLELRIADDSGGRLVLQWKGPASKCADRWRSTPADGGSGATRGALGIGYATVAYQSVLVSKRCRGLLAPVRDTDDLKCERLQAAFSPFVPGHRDSERHEPQDRHGCGSCGDDGANNRAGRDPCDDGRASGGTRCVLMDDGCFTDKLPLAAYCDRAIMQRHSRDHFPRVILARRMQGHGKVACLSAASCSHGCNDARIGRFRDVTRGCPDHGCCGRGHFDDGSRHYGAVYPWLELAGLTLSSRELDGGPYRSGGSDCHLIEVSRVTAAACSPPKPTIRGRGRATHAEPESPQHHASHGSPRMSSGVPLTSIPTAAVRLMTDCARRQTGRIAAGRRHCFMSPWRPHHGSAHFGWLRRPSPRVQGSVPRLAVQCR